MYVLAADGAHYNADHFAKIEAHSNNRSLYGRDVAGGYACHMEPLLGEHITIHVIEPEAVRMLETALAISSRVDD